MFNIDLKTKRNIDKYINIANKRQAGDFNDEYFLKIIVFWILLGIIPSAIGIILMETLPLVLLLPIVTFFGSIVLFINEMRLLNRNKKNDKKLNSVIEALETSNIKTNLKNLSKSIVLENVMINDNVPDDRLISNNCYIFKDNDGNLQGLLEDDSMKEKQYYTLEKEEVKRVVESSAKAKKLIRRKEFK